jgi:hypothetical protein
MLGSTVVAIERLTPSYAARRRSRQRDRPNYPVTDLRVQKSLASCGVRRYSYGIVQ